MKSKIILAALAASTASASAAITLATGPTSSAGVNFGDTFFAGVTANVGDVLVVSHSNNRRDNGNNTISLAGLTGNTVNTIAGGDSGAGAAGWVFYSSVTTAGTFDLTLNTNNTNLGVSESTTLYVLRSDTPGETLSIAATAAGTTDAGDSQTLNFTFGSTVTDAFGIVASGISNDAARDGNPAGYTADTLGGAGDIRGNFSNSGISGLTESVTFNSQASDPSDPSSDALAGFSSAGIVISAVPEPSTALLGALGSFLLIRRRR